MSNLTSPSGAAPPVAHLRLPVARWLRFWSRHLLLLNLILFGLVWLLYGDLQLHGYGEIYAARVHDLWLQQPESLEGSAPNVENLLLPALAAVVAALWQVLDWEFTTTTFMLVAIVPYALFALAVSWHLGRSARGRLLAVGAAAAIYTSGFVPYMTTWGGYVDGLGYLLLVPVFLAPESLAVYLVAFVLQCLNHYLGAVALLLFACVWHSLKAIGRPGTERWRYWLATVGPRVLASVLILLAFQWFWGAMYPDAAQARLATVLEKWQAPEAVLQEVLGPFPWTILSALKLAIVPVAALMLSRLPRAWLRAAIVAAPVAAAATLTFIFVDITRVATLLMMPALLVVLHAAAFPGLLPAAARRQLRRVTIAAALLNLLVPNFYVNNGEILLPRSRTMANLISEWAP